MGLNSLVAFGVIALTLGYAGAAPWRATPST